ncbi:MAG TPA: DNA primase [Bacteroidia bacterium]|nr:DNA primase [Bacteroidia bacterium]HNT79414.1 DNA primase [Bacteroidia bacterium]
MIPKQIIDHILEVARVDEIIGEFVQLKRRGSNLLGLCPFHNEKTPSFTVSPTKGIYKCFGCGKSGSAIGFLMEHEHFSYPEAIRFLADKYQIEIEEEHIKVDAGNYDEQLRESLFVILSFAQKYFSTQLNEHSEGVSIALPYLQERGFDESIIQKFQLGYSLNKWDAFYDAAKKEGFEDEFLIKAGVIAEKNGKHFDNFRGRIIFPIHNITGRVIAFGARQLKKEANSPKYLNSPETDIYYKSKVLYGLHQARNSISKKNECYLVEGYTDVISMHACGIENVVASSGTSLTNDQIRLIGRFTKDICILYDGDEAGIKASLRGIDLILEQGLNVRVVTFPEGDDPDSFAKKHSAFELREYIEKNRIDFLRFKASLLMKDTGDDPIKKTTAINEIVRTLSKIPNSIDRSIYLKECSQIMLVDENVLISELNKIIRKELKKDFGPNMGAAVESSVDSTSNAAREMIYTALSPSEFQESIIIRLLLLYSDQNISSEKNKNVPLFDFVLNEIDEDIKFEDELYAYILEELKKIKSRGEPINLNYFIEHEREDVRDEVNSLISSPYQLSDKSKYEKKGIYIPEEKEILPNWVIKGINSLKMKTIIKELKSVHAQIKECNDEIRLHELLEEKMRLDELKKRLSERLGIVVIR